jgi:hypothetical protein
MTDEKVTYVIVDQDRATAMKIITNNVHAFGRQDIRSYAMVVGWSDDLQEQYWYVEKLEDYDMLLQNLEKLKERLIAAKELSRGVVEKTSLSGDGQHRISGIKRR